MGDVWVARNEATQAELAVKTLQRAERSSVHDERFRREARLSATITHRNVVRVFDLVDEVDGTLGLVMELLHGSTLEESMRERGPFTGPQAVTVAISVLSAMHHVHEKGIVHRDMKPANVFFAVEPDGHVIPKVLDFGIAKLPAAGTALTVDGSVLGTPHYMSPEQIRGKDLDGRSDMFSLAVVLVEMLTGVQAFHRETAAASLAAVLEHEVDPDPRIDPRLWLAISRALAKRPYERFASCAEFAEALRLTIKATDEELAQALQDLRPTRVSAPPSSSSTSPSSVVVSSDQGRTSRRLGRSAILGAALLGVTVFIVSLTLALFGRHRESAVTGASPTSSGSMATGDARSAIALQPPLAPSSASSSSSSSSVGVAMSVDSAEPVASSSPPVRPASTTKRVGDKRGKPRSASGGVATTPGF